MERLWLPTANTADLLILIYRVYPELEGPDVPFRAANDGLLARRLGEADIESIRVDLAGAVEELERAEATFRSAGDVDAAEKHRWAARLGESVAAISSMLERLAAIGTKE